MQQFTHKINSPLPLYWRALEQCMPDRLVEKVISLYKHKLIINKTEININTKVNILAFGKASRLMYIAARKIVGDEFFGQGLLISHEANTELVFKSSRDKILKSSHPFITSLSQISGKEAKRFVEKSNESDILLVLVSGGGSAMVALPVIGLDLKEKINFITRIMHLSVPEREVNILKKALSRIKGGKLAEASTANTVVNCILSDERSHKISAISSGMTVHNKSINPIEIMDKYDLWGEASDNIKNALISHGEKKNIAKNKNIINYIVGSRENLIDKMINMSHEYEFDSTHLLDNIHSCKPEDAVDILIHGFLKIYNDAKKGNHLVISTGEVQVKVTQSSNSKGGRNQHLVALFMQKFKSIFHFHFIAIATDGMDYLEGVHGAFYTSDMRSKIEKNYDFIQSKIEESNSYAIHKKFGTLIEGNVTGTNMSDFFLFSFTKN